MLSLSGVVRENGVSLQGKARDVTVPGQTDGSWLTRPGPYFIHSNRRTSEEFFGPGGKPVDDLQGIAKVIISYDVDGKDMLHFYNLNGRQVSPTVRK